MRQLWRFLRIVTITTAYTIYTAIAAWRIDEDKRPAFRAKRQQIGCGILCRLLGIEVWTEGRLPDPGGMLYVSNHFGVLDPLVLASQLPVAFVGKAELRRWPFVGWVCSVMGVIFVDRDRRIQTASFVGQVRERLGAGVDVLVFPEGRTSTGQTVLPFKTGAFAAVAGMEDGRVLPLRLEAVEVEGRPAEGVMREKVVWADSNVPFLVHFWHLVGLRRVRMRVRVGEPVETDGLGRKELAEASHARVLALRD
jgi:lyso-ornithine lipid O-acyltransferase